MRDRKKWFVIVFICMAALMLTACGDDDDDNDITGPVGPINVAGPWSFAGQLTKNTCNFNVASTLTANITFNQSGTTVSTPRVDFSFGPYFYYQGTVSGNNVSMAAVDPYVSQSGGSVVHLGSGIDIANIQNNSGSGSLNLTGQCIQGCTGSCQTIWTGTWTKQ
jgi:hypothetical protein